MSKAELAGKIVGVLLILVIAIAFFSIPLMAMVGFFLGKVGFETAAMVLLSYIFFFSIL